MQRSSSLRFNRARSTLPYGRRKYLPRTSNLSGNGVMHEIVPCTARCCSNSPTTHQREIVQAVQCRISTAVQQDATGGPTAMQAAPQPRTAARCMNRCLLLC